MSTLSQDKALLRQQRKRLTGGLQLHSTPSHHSDHISVKIPDIVNSIKSVQIGSCDGKAPALYPHIYVGWLEQKCDETRP